MSWVHGHPYTVKISRGNCRSRGVRELKTYIVVLTAENRLMKVYLRLRMDFGKSAMPWPVIHRSTLSFFNLGGRYLRPASVTLVFSSFKLFNEAGRSYAIIQDKCVRTKPYNAAHKLVFTWIPLFVTWEQPLKLRCTRLEGRYLSPLSVMREILERSKCNKAGKLMRHCRMKK